MSNSRNKKKIAILTRRAGYNMGTSLQAYAMSKFVADAGYPNEIINYDEYSGHVLWQIKPIVNRLLLSAMNLVPSISRRLFVRKYAALRRARLQMDSFARFEKEYLPLTKRRYRSIKAMERDFHDYNACICGSDQIWSPYFFDPAFFLSFVTSKLTKKIAYAPSMGITDEKLIGDVQRHLIRNIDYLSCREAHAAQIVSHITGREVPVVLDPTLMVSVEEWERLAVIKNVGKEERYILTYFLHTGYYEDNIPNAYIEKLKKETGLPVYNVSLFNLIDLVEADKHFNTIGPLEFLSLVKNAEWVCTNSFHCCIFSYVFKRKFVVFERYMKEGNEGSNQNSRIYSLLDLLGMEYCLTRSNEQPNTEVKYDFSKGLCELQKQREKSLEFLLTALRK